MDIEATKETVTRESIAAHGGRGVWKYLGLLPVMNTKDIVSLGEGNTHLLHSKSLAELVGMRKLHLKDETTNPSGAFIDRGTTVDISRAKALGFKSAACGWSGNLAASLAAYCARGGMSMRAILPGQVDLGKLYQTVAYGAEIKPCSSRAEATDELLRECDDVYPVTSRNPFFLEGIKTTGIEIVDQMGWNAPDWVVVPVGNGSHLYMIYKALRELVQVGILGEESTRLVGVQVEGCSPVADLMRPPSTTLQRVHRGFARDIAIEKPTMPREAVAAATRTKGDVIAVPEIEILEAVTSLARHEGIFAEPASASTIAALKTMVASGKIGRSDSVVCVITGMGLKDPMMARSIARKNRVARNIISRYENNLAPRQIGDTKMTILRMLEKGEGYAYELRKRLVALRNREISLVSVYQHLAELETLGLISVERREKSSQRRTRVYYSITESGKGFLGSIP